MNSLHKPSTSSTSSADADQDSCSKPYDYGSQIVPNLATHGSSISNVKHNIGAVGDYQKLLFIGGGSAQKTSGSLGTTKLMKTKMPCTDVDNPDSTPTISLFQNNKAPMTNPDGSHANYGIIQGIEANLGELKRNISGFGDVFSTNPPPCQHISITATCNDGPRPQSGYVKSSVVDIMDPCLFIGGKNPNTGKTCKVEGFENFSIDNETRQRPGHKPQHHNSNGYNPVVTKKINNNIYNMDMPDDPLIKIYYASIGLLMLYILMRMTVHTK